MKYISNTEITQNMPGVVTLGNFDGLHLGHRKLIEMVKETAQNNNYQSIVFSFYPHPQMILNSNRFPGMIFSRYEKKNRLKDLGIDCYIEYPFTRDFANISPEEFVEEILIEQLKTRIIIIGSNNRFGRKQEGDIHFLKERQKKWGISVIEMPPVLYDYRTVSSTRLREELIKGNIEKVNKLLKVPYSIAGKVIKGKRLGHTLGYPTANILSQEERLYPPNGVYITSTKWNNKTFPSVTNIGYNPTVNGKQKIIETHIIDFDNDIYGEMIEVEFYQWIRKEVKFSKLEELIQQLESDVGSAKLFFTIV